MNDLTFGVRGCLRLLMLHGIDVEVAELVAVVEEVTRLSSSKWFFWAEVEDGHGSIVHCFVWV